jgi:hypothetical protein
MNFQVLTNFHLDDAEQICENLTAKKVLLSSTRPMFRFVILLILLASDCITATTGSDLRRCDHVVAQT